MTTKQNTPSTPITQVSADLITMAADLILACPDHRQPAYADFDSNEEVITVFDNDDNVLGTLVY